jgi:glycosyltransferase involved in cell wall biosynthesis
MKKKILFIIPRLGIGGAQKVLSIVLNNLDRQKFESTLCLLEGGGEYMSGLSPDIRVIDLRCKRVAQAVFRIIAVIKEIQPHIVFSGLSHLNLAVALCIPFVSGSIKFIARETNIPSINHKQNAGPRLFNFMYRRLYPRYAKIVCQSRDMEKDLAENYNIPKERLTVINNPIETDKNQLLAQTEERLFDGNKINLLAAGKLKHQKGFDLLLEALAQVHDERFHLTVLGKGELEAALKKQAEELAIADRVTFAGEVKNPYPYMRQADVFILSSRFEGFPNVVLEALSLGTPVIAFDCKGGLNEIIADGVNGKLVEAGNVAAIAKAILDYKSLNSGNIEKSVARFDISVIKKQYAELMMRDL